jgi:hypothetical protein
VLVQGASAIGEDELEPVQDACASKEEGVLLVQDV